MPLVAASLLALPAEAQWKWRDKGGHVQYSDLPPPPGTADKDILKRPSARRSTRAGRRAGLGRAGGVAAVASAPAPRTAEPELEAKRKKAEDEAAAKNKAEQEKIAAARGRELQPRQARSCDTLESGIRLVAGQRQDGEREFLDDKQTRRRIKPRKDVIANDCTASSAVSAGCAAGARCARRRRASFGSIASGR